MPHVLAPSPPKVHGGFLIFLLFSANLLAVPQLCHVLLLSIFRMIVM
jgi:hypothetical protein